jgi:hypothetical protein
MQQLSNQVQHVVEQRRAGLEQMRDLYRTPILPATLEHSQVGARVTT